MKQQFIGRMRTLNWGNNFFPALSPYPAQLGDATELDAKQIIPPGGDGTARNLKVRAIANGMAGGTEWTIYIRKNGSNTALKCAVTSATGTTEVLDASNEIAFAEDDEILINIVNTVGFPTDVTFLYSYEYETTGNVSIYGFGHNATQPSNSGVKYCGVFSAGPDWNDFPQIDIVAVPGNIIGMNARLSATPGAGKSRELAVMLNGTKQDGTGGTVDTVLLISDAETFEKKSFSRSTSTANRLAIKHTPSGTPTAANVIGAVTFEATEANRWNLAGHCVSSPSNVATNYVYPVSDCYTEAWSGTESAFELEAPITSMALSGLMVAALTTAPGSGNSFDYTLRKEGADTAQTVQMAGAATITSASAGADVVFTSSESMALQAVPTSTPVQPGGLAWVFEAITEPATIICATVFGQNGTVTSSNTFLANLDTTTRDVSAPGCMYVAGYFVLHEQGSAPTPIANTAILFTKDTGGKTELLVQFPTGSAIQIAIEA